jgi:hypothetical protein
MNDLNDDFNGPNRVRIVSQAKREMRKNKRVRHIFLNCIKTQKNQIFYCPFFLLGSLFLSPPTLLSHFSWRPYQMSPNGFLLCVKFVATKSF